MCLVLSIYLSPCLGFGICVLIIVYLFVTKSGLWHNYVCSLVSIYLSPGLGFSICVLIIVYLFVNRSWLWYMCAHYCLFICHKVWVQVYVCSSLSIYLSPGIGFGGFMITSYVVTENYWVICVLIIVYLFVTRYWLWWVHDHLVCRN